MPNSLWKQETRFGLVSHRVRSPGGHASLQRPPQPLETALVGTLIKVSYPVQSRLSGHAVANVWKAARGPLPTKPENRGDSPLFKNACSSLILQVDLNNEINELRVVSGANRSCR